MSFRDSGLTRGSEMLILVVGLPNVLHQDIWRRKLKASKAVSADLVLAEWMGLPRFRSSQVPRGWDLNLFARYRCIHGTRVAWTTPHQSTDSNNNNNPIWGCSVSTGEEPPPHSGETSHALSQVGAQPNPIPSYPAQCRQDTTSPWSTAHEETSFVEFGYQSQQ